MATQPSQTSTRNIACLLLGGLVLGSPMAYYAYATSTGHNDWDAWHERAWLLGSITSQALAIILFLNSPHKDQEPQAPEREP